MKHYLQHSEKDSDNQKYIEVVFDIKNNNFKIALMYFSIPDKKLLKYNVIKQINKNDEYKNHFDVKTRLSKKQIEEIKLYL